MNDLLCVFDDFFDVYSVTEKDKQELLSRLYPMQDKLEKIARWADAYPLDIFPEPDLKKAAKALKENGMTLDAISASNMRHVLTGIKNILDT